MAGKRMRLVVWNTRAALLYSLGGWTILGGMLHYTMNRGKSGDAAATGELGAESADTAWGHLGNESDPQAKPALKQEIYTKETALGFTVTTIITHRDVQPPITQLLRRVKSYFFPDDSPPSEN